MVTIGPAEIALVHGIARRLRRRLPRGIELDDLLAEGLVGLLDAARRYEPRREAGHAQVIPFAAYARHRVRGAMLDYCERSWRHVATAATSDPVEDLQLATPVDGRADASISVSWLIRRLDQLEAQVIRLRYRRRPLTYGAIAARLRASIGDVRQIEERALARMREEARAS